MKRPLCLLAVLLTAAVFIYLEIFSSDITGKAPEKPDQATVTVTGMVQGKEFRRSFDGEILPVIYLIPNSEKIQKYSLIQCYLDSSEALPEIGTYASVSGKVKIFTPPTNPGEFDSRLYYSSLKILYRLSSCRVLDTAGKADGYRETLFRMRMFFEGSLDLCLSWEDAAIMKAMLLGDKAYMDAEVKDMYKESGIIHILAVSGLHISIIGMGVYRLINLIILFVSGLFDLLLDGNLSFAFRLRRGLLRFGPGGAEGYFGRSVVAFFEKYCLGKVLSSGISVFVMYSYGVMCGMGTSSFRAICMFALRIIAPVLGRTYDILSALALSGILLLLDQPLYLYNSGFLFSFGAVLGITVVRPLLVPAKVLTGEFEEKMKFVEEKPMERDGILGVLLKFVNLNDCKALARKTTDGLVNSLAIVITTLPVYACFYYTYPLHSLLLNLLVIPVMGVLMLFGMAGMLLSGAGMLNVPVITAADILKLFGKLAGFAVHVILAFYRWLCSGSAIRRDFTWYMGHSEKWQVFVYVSFVTLFVIISLGLQSRSDLIYKIRKNMDLFRVFLLVLAVYVLTFHIDPEFAIDMIDVGQGDGIVISCGDKHMLIDGGSTSKKNVGKYRIIPFLKYKGIGKLDAVVMTHEDEDHISGILEVMDDMEKGGILIKQLILPEVSEKSRGENYNKLEKRALELGISVSYINTGESFRLGKASFLCLNPQKNMVTEGANAYSTVLYMKYGNFTALFTGDMEEEGLENVKEVLRASDIKDIILLKVAHHGSRYTNDEEFLKLLKPKLALISCGLDNRYGHPHEEVLERLDDIHSKIYRTDECGEIRVLVEKGKVHVSQWGRFRLTH